MRQARLFARRNLSLVPDQAGRNGFIRGRRVLEFLISLEWEKGFGDLPKSMARTLVAFWMIVWRAKPPEDWFERAAARVSKAALWAVVAIVASGSYLAYLGLGFDLDHLLYSSYGRTLMVKIAIFAAVLPFGAYNRFWLIPQIDTAPPRRALLRNVGIEALIIAAPVRDDARQHAADSSARDDAGDDDDDVTPIRASGIFFTIKPTNRLQLNA